MTAMQWYLGGFPTFSYGEAPLALYPAFEQIPGVSYQHLFPVDAFGNSKVSHLASGGSFYGLPQTNLYRNRNTYVPDLNYYPLLQAEETPEARQQPVSIPQAPRVLAEWDGYVERIYDDYFEARMRGLQGVGVKGKSEEADIPKSDVDDSDQSLIVPGGLFRLTISYETPKPGVKRRYTSVQFRRLPAYSQRDLNMVEREADELFNGIQLAESQRSAQG